MTTIECVQRRLLELCDKHRITVNGLANLSGVHPCTAKSIMNGASQNPGVVTLKKLCDGMNISITDFFDTDYFRELEQEIR